MDSSISENQEHGVDVVALNGVSILIELVDNLSEVGGSCKLSLRQDVVVRLHDALNTLQGRILWVAIQREAMADASLSVALCDSTKAKGREHLRFIVWLKDRANLLDSLCVLIVGAVVVKGLRVALLTI